MTQTLTETALPIVLRQRLLDHNLRVHVEAEAEGRRHYFEFPESDLALPSNTWTGFGISVQPKALESLKMHGAATTSHSDRSFTQADIIRVLTALVDRIIESNGLSPWFQVEVLRSGEPRIFWLKQYLAAVTLQFAVADFARGTSLDEDTSTLRVQGAEFDRVCMVRRHTTGHTLTYTVTSAKSYSVWRAEQETAGALFATS